MRFDVLTLLPKFFQAAHLGVTGRAFRELGHGLHLHSYRPFAGNAFGHVDDTPYGGGPGMAEVKSRWDDAPSFGSGYTSPGWKRAQARGSQFAGGGHRQPVIEGDGRLVVNAGASGSAYARGDRVFHQKFGYGQVKSIEGNKLVVAFDKAGEKKVIDSFVEKA